MPRRPRLLLLFVAIGLALSSIHAATLLWFRHGLQKEIKRTVVGRDSAVFQPVVRQQITQAEIRTGTSPLRVDELLSAVLPSAQQEGMLAMAVFDKQGALLRALPDTLLFAELSAEDYLSLLAGTPVSRFHADLPLDRYFSGTVAAATAPVLEVLLPLEGRVSGQQLGFAQYYLDARALNDELALIDRQQRSQTWATFALGTGLIALVLSAAYQGLIRAQRLIQERNARLARANSELTLSAKTSALGQITSHLIHGLQGSVAGLCSVVSAESPDKADWETAARYADRMRNLIAEIVCLLGDAHTGARAEIAGWELAEIIRQRNTPVANAHGIRLLVKDDLTAGIDGHTGSILCLIASNLVHNAVKASPRGSRIEINFTCTKDRISMVVLDEGTGIPPNVHTRLFEPGVTGGPDGSGLGLAISRLLARQIHGELDLLFTGPTGTAFCVSMPTADVSSLSPPAVLQN
jgi:signal transduction histidine kinase